MAGGTQPLIARPPSQLSDESRGIAEEDALLTGKNTGKQATSQPSRRRTQWREIGLFIWALVTTAAVVILAVLFHQAQQQVWGHDGVNPGKNEKRNLIFMVSDGMGPTSLALTRSWKQHVQQSPANDTLILDEHLIGQSRTRSSSSLVTDSAAGATAFSCGLKSYNGAISVLPNGEPCGSVMEAAKRMGYTTGLVVTTRLTDATPAVFVSHVRKRDLEDEIALQMVGETHPLGRMVDLMMGGGRCTFLPNTTEDGCRADDVDVAKLAQERDWHYISTRKDFDSLSTHVELPLLALLAHEDIPYEIDRQHEQEVYPSLEEMTRKALNILSEATKDSEKGFFVMIEGSRIDHAGHANDPAAQVHEVLAYDRAMSAVLDFIETSEVPTVMVSTSDHETGGVATARQLRAQYPQYLWFPGVLANASQSAGRVARDYISHVRQTGVSEDMATLTATTLDDLESYIRTLTQKSLGIWDVSRDEVDSLIKYPALAAYTFADMVSTRAQVGWTTHGHSGADVNIYTSSVHAASALRGNHENTEVGAFLRSFLDLDEEVAKVTQELRDHAKIDAVSGNIWLGEIPEEDERLDGQDHLEHYHGDHRRRGCNCKA